MRPGITVLERAVANARVEAEYEIARRLEPVIDPALRSALDELAVVPAGRKAAPAISSRSANVRQRPFKPRPRRGRTPPASRSQTRPRQRRVPAAAAASVRNSPACIAAQNGCTDSATSLLENLTINTP